MVAYIWMNAYHPHEFRSHEPEGYFLDAACNSSSLSAKPILGTWGMHLPSSKILIIFVPLQGYSCWELNLQGTHKASFLFYRWR